MEAPDPLNKAAIMGAFLIETKIKQATALRNTCYTFGPVRQCDGGLGGVPRGRTPDVGSFDGIVRKKYVTSESMQFRIVKHNEKCLHGLLIHARIWFLFPRASVETTGRAAEARSTNQ